MGFKRIAPVFIILAFFIYCTVMYSAFNHVPSRNEELGPDQISRNDTSPASDFTSLEANDTIEKAVSTVESITKVILLIIIFGLVFMELVLVLIAK